MGKKVRFFSGVLVGALLQYLFDPDRGRSRRARLADQAAARARDAKEAMGRKMRYEQGRMKGMVHEMTTSLGNGDLSRPASDDVVLQRIRSQVLGNSRADIDEIEIRVEEGVVVLGGRAPKGSKDELLERVRRVDGVKGVRDETVSV